MKLICVVDDRMGMAFGGKRQSRDRILSERILSLVGEDSVWMTPSSASLFPSGGKAIRLAETPMQSAKPGDWCFVELPPLSPCASQIESIRLFRWNRHYPSDAAFDLDLSARKCTPVGEFAGSSHDRITEEEWT